MVATKTWLTVFNKFLENFKTNTKFSIFVQRPQYFWSDSSSILIWIKLADNWKPFTWNTVCEICLYFCQNWPERHWAIKEICKKTIGCKILQAKYHPLQLTEQIVLKFLEPLVVIYSNICTYERHKQGMSKHFDLVKQSLESFVPNLRRYSGENLKGLTML